MFIALSGTPGTGKTAVARVLQQKGYTVINLNSLAIRQGFVIGVDKKRNTKIVDVPAVNNFIKKMYSSEPLIFFEGHFAHLLNAVTYVILLRCHPSNLQQRLQHKRWNQTKIQENVEAETIDIILCEASELHQKKNIFEIDTTQKTIEDVAAIIQQLVKRKFRPTKTYSIGQIDWSEELLKNFPP